MIIIVLAILQISWISMARFQMHGDLGSFSLEPVSTHQATVPHVSECNFCMHCSSDDAGMQQPAMEPMSPDVFSKIYPTDEEIKAKGLKPNCTECQGCSTQLQPLKAVTAFGQSFSVEAGASPEWIFIAGGTLSQELLHMRPTLGMTHSAYSWPICAQGCQGEWEKLWLRSGVCLSARSRHEVQYCSGGVRRQLSH